MAPATPSDPSASSSLTRAAAATIVPLRSDPAWMGRGVLLTNVLCVVAFVLYFRTLPGPHLSWTYALLPGLAFGTFASASVAWWARRHGGTMQLEAHSDRLVLDEPGRKLELVDRAVPFGAVIVADTSSARRILVLSQQAEPTMILDVGAVESAGVWAERTLRVDLSGVALSPATAHVLTVRRGQHIDPVLAALADDLDGTAPLLKYPLLSGEVLIVQRDEIRVGPRVFPVGSATTARRISVRSHHGDVAALSLTCGESALLLAGLDPNDIVDPRASADAPDAHLPALVFAVVATLFGLEPGTGTVASGAYRP